MLKRLSLLSLATLLTLIASAQQSATNTGGVPKKGHKKWSFGLNFGANSFYGDIRQYDWAPVLKTEAGKSKSELGFGIQGSLSRSLSNVFGLRGSMMYGTLSGMKRDPKFTTLRSTYFTSNFIEYDITAYANISNMFYTDKSKARRFTLYAFGGAGLMHFRTLKKKLYTDEFVASQGYTNNGNDTKKMTTETVFPVGAGIKVRLSKSLDLSLEGTLFNVNSDKVDATEGASRVKDKYLYTSIGVAYKFGRKGAEETAEWVNPYGEIASNIEDVQTNIDGLVKDADGDGVADHFDKEPNTPAGVTVDGAGRAVDTDADGVPDHIDADPFTAKGAKVGSDGKELDSDGDGVFDSKDLEPNTPAGTLVNFQGRTINVKPADSAPGTAVVSSLPSIYFKVNSSRIDYWSSYDKLATIAQALKANPTSKLKITGFADPTGSEAINKSVSEKRAQAAADHLKKIYGIEGSSLIIDSKGKTELLSNVAEGYNVNRRVDFQLTK